MERKVEAPEKQWLSDPEAAAWLNMDVDDFRLEVRTGRFPFLPAGGRKTRRWNWLDLVSYSHMVARRCPVVIKGGEGESEE